MPLTEKDIITTPGAVCGHGFLVSAPRRLRRLRLVRRHGRLRAVSGAARRAAGNGLCGGPGKALRTFSQQRWRGLQHSVVATKV